MEITTHDFWTAMHGMGFGALFMLAFSGALAELFRMSAPGVPVGVSDREHKIVVFYLIVTLNSHAIGRPRQQLRYLGFPKYWITAEPRDDAQRKCKVTSPRLSRSDPFVRLPAT
jgi:hypothetical protein